MHVSNGIFELAQIDNLQFLPVLDTRVDSCKSLNSVLIGWLELVKNLPIDANRIVGLLQLFLVQLTYAPVQLNTLARFFVSRCTLLEHAGKFRPRTERGVNSVEVFKHLRFLRDRREDVSIRLFRLGDIRQFFFENSG